MIRADDIVKNAPQYLGVPYSKLDCQAFVEKVLSDCGIHKNLAGSNAWYRYLAQSGWVGTPDECKKKYGSIPPGAFLFILSDNGKEPEKYQGDGVGNASHIGIYTGLTGKKMCDMAHEPYALYGFGNGAIHSSSSRGCVCTSNFSGKAINGGWNRIGLWNEIDYGMGGDTVSYQARVVGGGLNMRKTASTASERLCQIPDGTLVHVEEEAGEWAKTSYSGHTGWVLSRYLEKTGEDSETLLVSRKELESIYDKLGDMLGLRG